MNFTATRPAGLEDAEVYVHDTLPEAWGRWYVRPDGTVVGRLPSGVWNPDPAVNAVIVRSSRRWVRQVAEETA